MVSLAHVVASMFALLVAHSFALERFCYFSNSAQYRAAEGKFLPEDIDPTLCSHVLYAYAVIDVNCHFSPYEWNDFDLYDRVNAHKESHPELRTVLILVETGNELCNISNEDHRLELANSGATYLRQHNFDGLDVEFASPRGGETYKNDFLFLMQEFRGVFDAEAAETGNETLLLMTALYARTNFTDIHYDIPSLNEVLDWFILRTYELYPEDEEEGGMSGFTFHHSPLYLRTDQSDADQELNMNFSVHYLLSLGAARDKVVVGVAPYGIGFVLANRSCVDIGCAHSGPTPMAPYTRIPGLSSYYEICLLHEEEDSEEVWHGEHMVPYTISSTWVGDDQTWIGHDNPTSLELKKQYIVDENLAGWAFTLLDMDDFNGVFCYLQSYPLLHALQ